MTTTQRRRARAGPGRTRPRPGPADAPAGPSADAEPTASEPAASEPPAPEPPVSGPTQLAKVIGTVVAPTTLVTALLYYFGWAHAYYFFNYFGVNSTVLGFTPVDYLMRSVDTLFVPVTVAAVAALFALWGGVMLRDRLADRPDRDRRRVLLAVAGAGGLLAAAGLVSYLTPTPLRDHLAAAPLSVAVGVLVVAYAVHVRRFVAARTGSGRRAGPGWAPAAEWALVFAIVGTSLFGAATDYAAAVGRSRASDFVAQLPSQPDVALYSDRDLSLHATGVRMVRCRDPQAAYRFRYDGLKLMLQSGGQYLLLPAAWTPAQGVAILLPRASTMRLEFSPAPGWGPAPADAC